MDDFLNALPWRLGALAGLVVGAVSFICAATDFWSGLERIGAAFVLFFVVGSVARKLLIVATPRGLQKRSVAHKAPTAVGGKAP